MSKQTIIEKEFKHAMKTTYSKVPVGSPQYKISRVLFYMGAVAALSYQDSGDFFWKELMEDVGLAAKMAEKGLQPENTFADLVESRE